MEEKDLQVSKFMKSMMNSNELGFNKDGDKRINNDNEDSVWDCISYMFKVKNLWIYAIFAFLTIFAKIIFDQDDLFANFSVMNKTIIGIFATLGYALIYGYLFPFIKSLSEQQKTYTMPKFKFWQCLGLFFKFNIALALFVISFAILPIIIAIFFTGSNPANQPILIVFGIIMLLVLCFFCFYFPAMLWLFSNKGYWTSFVHFKEIFNLVKRNKNRYLDSIGASICIFIISSIICFVIPICSTIIATYLMFAGAYICAKCISAKELES